MTDRLQRRSTSLAVLVTATLVATAGLVGLQVGPASAVSCSTSGITAVVDGGAAGGGTSSGCDRVTGSRKAVTVFDDVGVSLRRNPDGSVCQVNGRPANASCGGLGNQYWGLFWSNGQDGQWAYAQQGVDDLTVPTNGSVAWAWQSSAGQRKPGASAPVVTPAPKPTPTPTPKPTRRPTPKPAPTTAAATSATPTAAVSSSAAAGTATPSPSARAKSRTTAGANALAAARASASASASASARASASASASSSAPTTLAPTNDASPLAAAEPASSDLSSADQGGLPAWVPVLVLALLALGAGGAVWWRKRTAAA